MLGAAGCAGAPAACEEAECPPPAGASASHPRPATGTDAALPPLANVTLPRFEFENCTGILAIFETPEGTAQRTLPPDFNATSRGLPGVASLYVEVYECPRALLPGRVAERVSMLWAAVRVRPRDPTWAGGATSYYVHALLVNHTSVAEALTALGARPQMADFESSKQALPNGTDAITLTATAGDQSFEVSYHRASRPGERDVRERMHWFGSTPYARLRVDHRATYDEMFRIDAGTLRLSGQTPFVEAAGGRAVLAYDGGSIHNLYWALNAFPDVVAAR